MICIQICASNEWESFQNIMGFHDNQYREYPYGTFIGKKIGGIECIFYHSEATKTRSAGACQFAIDHWTPKRIIVFGTAGGIDIKLKNLDLVIASSTGQYDCIEGMGAKNEFFYKLFSVKLDNSWIDFSKLPSNVYSGMIATADKDVDFAMGRVLRKQKVLAADWESGAIAHICFLNKMPCCIFRGISDMPGVDNNENNSDFIRNTPEIMRKLLQEVLPALLSMGTNE